MKYYNLSQDAGLARMISCWLWPNHPGRLDDTQWGSAKMLWSCCHTFWDCARPEFIQSFAKLVINLQAAASAAELQILIISIKNYDFMDFICFSNSFHQLWYNLVILGGWKWKQTYSCNETDVIAQSGGRDSLSKSMCSIVQIPFFAGKSKIDSSIKNLSFIMVLWETAWGKMCVLTVGSFQVFIKIMTLIRVLHVKVHVFPKTSIFIFSV